MVEPEVYACTIEHEGRYYRSSYIALKDFRDAFGHHFNRNEKSDYMLAVQTLNDNDIWKDKPDGLNKVHIVDDAIHLIRHEIHWGSTTPAQKERKKSGQKIKRRGSFRRYAR